MSGSFDGGRRVTSTDKDPAAGRWYNWSACTQLHDFLMVFYTAGVIRSAKYEVGHQELDCRELRVFSGCSVTDHGTAGGSLRGST